MKSVVQDFFTSVGEHPLSLVISSARGTLGNEDGLGMKVAKGLKSEVIRGNKVTSRVGSSLYTY